MRCFHLFEMGSSWAFVCLSIFSIRLPASSLNFVEQLPHWRLFSESRL